ncbi:hypothetical protein TNCT_241421 [Trichonephila clavata]|uniref:Uncharacterized protein n=1 Tax=Trichonephila clavata TaxID=2740835 RepID=A0A8X6LMU2_TRICU|nr:hypothetical protein TNCT_241421 [Trichonephila clavata]
MAQCLPVTGAMKPNTATKRTLWHILVANIKKLKLKKFHHSLTFDHIVYLASRPKGTDDVFVAISKSCT